MAHEAYALFFRDLANDKVALVGGKNASLSEMFNRLTPQGIQVPNGFATTAAAYWLFLDENHLREPLAALLAQVEAGDFGNLQQVGAQARALLQAARLPAPVATAICQAYQELRAGYPVEIQVAVRSSATAEDLPTASFAGQHDSFLNVRGEQELLQACQRCFVSLFNDRAIKYRLQHGFDHLRVALSVGVQTMVRSDLASAGVAFTIEPETGHENLMYLTGSWGLGENVVQGAVNPDEFYLFKPAVRSGNQALVSRKLGDKAKTMVYAQPAGAEAGGIENTDTPAEKRATFVLTDAEVEQLGRWFVQIEDHYGMPMDIEWAKDGLTNTLYIVQARPETIHHGSKALRLHEYHLTQKGPALATGKAVGSQIAAGIARLIASPAEGHRLQPGDILVTDITSPDWNTVLKKAAVIVTNKGGRTSHAAIVARELGLSAVVGTLNATDRIQDGQRITVSCAEGDEGQVFAGELSWQETDLDLAQVALPRTSPLLILADPDRALQLARYPSQGVGLMRMEFVINNTIRVHPMALVAFDTLQDAAARQEIEQLTAHYPSKPEYFVDKLAQAIGFVAAAFYPREVIVRLSDFKTNEYANLLGGRQFEPTEENPMLGFRGASRYYSPQYREGFRLECEALRRVRLNMGLTNVKVMVPFCRTVAEGRQVVALMEEFGLKRGEQGLQVYVMAEIPSNVILAEEFAAVFDGFSIGSNDLTQLTLGIDRDSAIVSHLFDENNEAVLRMLAQVIRTARACGRPIGLCGQAPSDYPAFARFLVEQGISSISFTPDALLKGLDNMVQAEQDLARQAPTAEAVLAVPA
ncbi:phosphoenolpyruvate synthase [Microvirga sp. STR05]|uniref:Phosphoenolpyruvate synthase n=1 Tax=Hymenobacter duratus TaxID=2771356 RepID=A0ABR8JI50_9BACT|nr:phosphoenolpyruvate synthase [Hymenobacter duratus]MBD2716520.1 phosphoenolpyruvate synthase [Hymenobacter duratus]MBR7951435.1 phosphoenolpyruvate synthase [Microvirga sp. STR05]